jgi:uncharacterized protein
MKRILAVFLTAIFGLMLINMAKADELRVATGDQKLTYSRMFKELQGQCQSIEMREVASQGSNDNIDMLLQNQVNAAIVQTDVLFWRSQTEDDLKNVKTVFALHPEEVHFIARADGVHVGGMSAFGMSVGGKQVVFNNIGDLAGHTVGAVGGSTLTAEVIKAQAKINYVIVNFNNNADANAALQAGKIDAFVAVGGAPLGNIAALGSDYKLLTITPAQQKALSNVYRPARLSYANLNQRGVDTVATDALLVSRVYTSPAKLDQLKRLRACFVKAVPNLKDTTGTHPKWQLVDPTNLGKWSYYDLK